MTYFCFIESDILTVPHMEPLMAESDDEAIVEAEVLLASHVSGYAAHVLRGEQRVCTLRKDGHRQQRPASPPTLGACVARATQERPF